MSDRPQEEADVPNDLYPVNADVSAMNLRLARYMEPVYDAFLCPLSKRVMDDPVTIDSGVTYEREAVTKWFEKNQDQNVHLICPESGTKLKSRIMSSNTALKATIDEWKRRNEMGRIEVARSALSLASTDNMVLEALEDLRNLRRDSDADYSEVPAALRRFCIRSSSWNLEELGKFSCLAETVPGLESMTRVAERASPALIEMVHSGNSVTKNAALKALKQISSHHLSAKILAQAGILKLAVGEMCAEKINHELMNTENEAAAILANILESGLELDNSEANSHDHKMASDYIVHEIIHRIKNSNTDELNINLLRILQCLIRSQKALCIIVSAVKETEASYNLIELINIPNEELGVASMKLLITLSEFTGHVLSDRLCKSKGLPEDLIRNPQEITQITEKEALSAYFLAKLPHQNLKLNLALVNSNTVLTRRTSRNSCQIDSNII